MFSISRINLEKNNIRVKSNFTKVNLHILLFSFILNYVDGQYKIIESLKPTLISSPVHKYMKHKRSMFKVNNKDIRTVSLAMFWCLYC